jgi:hypothetical protein
MLDIRKPLGLLFILLGAILFLYGMFLQKEVMFFTPQTKFPLKLNMPVGLFMFAFGMVMWQLSRYVNIVRLERGLKAREKELEGRPSTEPVAAETQSKAAEEPQSKAEGEQAKLSGEEGASAEGGKESDATEKDADVAVRENEAGGEKDSGASSEKTD